MYMLSFHFGLHPGCAYLSAFAAEKEASVVMMWEQIGAKGGQQEQLRTWFMYLCTLTPNAVGDSSAGEVVAFDLFQWCEFRELSFEASFFYIFVAFVVFSENVPL